MIDMLAPGADPVVRTGREGESGTEEEVGIVPPVGAEDWGSRLAGRFVEKRDPQKRSFVGSCGRNRR